MAHSNIHAKRDSILRWFFLPLTPFSLGWQNFDLKIALGFGWNWCFYLKLSTIPPHRIKHLHFFQIRFYEIQPSFSNFRKKYKKSWIPNPVVILERTDWPKSTRLTPLSIYQSKEECEYWAGIFKESLGARNRGGRGLSYRPAARIHRLAEFIPWNRFRGPIHV